MNALVTAIDNLIEFVTTHHNGCELRRQGKREWNLSDAEFAGLIELDAVVKALADKAGLQLPLPANEDRFRRTPVGFTSIPTQWGGRSLWLTSLWLNGMKSLRALAVSTKPKGKKGPGRPENEDKADILKAFADGKTTDKVAEQFGISVVNARRIKCDAKKKSRPNS